MSVRITGLQEVATLQSGDYIAIDNESNGTHKFDAMKMGANMASNIAPAYSTAATYAIGDFCMHDGILYKCTTAINTPESWTASHWTQTSAGVALAQKVDKVSGKGLSQNDFTNTLKTKLDGIASGAEVNVQADWAQTNTSADDYIKNKPVDATSSVGGLMSASDKAKLDGIASGAEVNVQADWTETNTSSDAYIKNKPTNATSSTAGLMSAADKAKLDGIASGAEVNVQADWSQTNTSADDYIKNKPVDATSSVGGLMSATDKAKLDTIEQGAEVNVQADWNQTNTSADDYIKNKPTNATTSTAGLMSASDKTKLNGIETGAQVNVIDGVKVDGTLLTVDGNKDVDIVGKANQASLAPQYSSDTGNYVRGNYVIYQNNLYKCLQDTSGVWDATKWEQVDIGDDLEQKANIDGLYEEMTVGGAEQLISDTFNIESVPYNFRTSGGSLEIGDRETDKLIGGTVAWNQLAKVTARTHGSGVVISVDANGGAILNGTATSTDNNVSLVINAPIKAGHKYYFNGGTTNNPISISTSGSAPQIVSVSSDGYTNIQTAIVSGTTYNNVHIPITLVDLTAMFGTTIADYIYSLEQNTAGAGVAFFKKLFPAPYYAYNAGQLMSVNAGSHVMNGFNQWDEEWELGAINSDTGMPSTSTTIIRAKNYIPILSNTNYYFNVSNIFRVFWYDSNKNYIGYVGNYNSPMALTPPTNARYMKFHTVATTYNNDICINIAWDGERNGEYEPYVSHAYELDDTLELRGIPKLDANNQLYYDGDVYESDGTVTRKWNSLNLGNINWGYSDSGYFYASVGDKANGNYNLICAKYTTTTADSVSGMTDKQIKGHASSYNIYIKDSAYNDPAAFKTAMSGVYLVYELDTPTTESATPYTNPQIVDDWGTETYTDYSYDAQTRDVQIPVGHETRYMANLKAKLEMAPESPTGDGDYIVRQTSGENAYVAIGSSPTIQHKADIDGTYDEMNVGGAKQLLSNVFEEDQVPYTFRTSGGSIDIGDREYDTVVGGTVAWNQLVQNGNFASADGWSVYNSSKASLSVANNTATVSFLSDGAGYTHAVYRNIIHALKESHKYLVTLDMNATKTGLYAVDVNGNSKGKTFSVSEANVWVRNGFIFTATSNQATSFFVEPVVEITSSDTMKVRNVGMFDLTQMFGSTIADYIYSLEQANAGAGVAWFKKLFPKPYYEYNAGELMSVKTSAHQMVGFNQFDKSTATDGKFVNVSGQEVTSANYGHSAIIPVFPSTTYYMKGYAGTSYYSVLALDIEQNPIGTFYGGASKTEEFSCTLPSNCYYVILNYLLAQKDSVCFNLHWDGERDGEYEAYKTWSYALDDSLTLRGIPKLDASNNLYYDGDTYESDGTVTRRYGIVDLGTLKWTASSVTGIFYTDLSDGVSSVLGGGNAISSAYPVVPITQANQFSNKMMVYANSAWSSMAGRLVANDDTYSTSANFRTAMDGKYLVYELAEPTTETADTFQSPQIVDDWGTEEYVTTSIVPVGHDTKYTANLRAKIEMAPDSPSGDGDYIVRQADGTNSYVPLVIPNELPTMPTTDGIYRLQVVVASGTPTLSWVSAT